MSNLSEESRCLESENLTISIKRVQNLMILAQRRNIAINNNITKAYGEAVEAISQDKKAKANIKITETWIELGKIVRSAKWHYRYGYYFLAHGGLSWLFSILALVSLLYLLHFHPDVIVITLGKDLAIPLWSLIMGGIGAAIQIMVRAALELREYGIVFRYERAFYAMLPCIGMIFGLIMYLFIKSGIWNPEITKLNNFVLMLLCFMAGYATDWFMERLEIFMRKI